MHEPHSPVRLGAISVGPYTFHNIQPYPLSPDTADFRDFGDRIKLGKLGIFSIDRGRRPSCSAV